MAESWIRRNRALFAQRRRVMDAGRMVYFSTKMSATDLYWEDQWRPVLTRDYFAPYLRGELSEFTRPFTHYLPKTGVILEAGCGTGQFVAALRARGYDAIGVDYAEETVSAVQKILPDLPISFGDVTHLDQIDAGTIAAVISLGVVEHRREGPEPFLEETWRILRPSGIFLISVPWLNPWRRRRARHGAYRDDVAHLDFFQFAFSVPEFTAYLNKAGFKVIDKHPYEPRTGLGEDVPLMVQLEKFPPLAKAIYRCGTIASRTVSPWLGHMCLYVAQKV